MKLLTYFVICATLFLAGCGKRGEAKVELIGSTPTSSIYKDQRVVKVICPACSAENSLTDAKCRNCGAVLHLPSSVKCAYCDGTGDCPVCRVFGTKGLCRFCNGKGIIDGKPCFNCGGTGKCPICKGTQKCDFCKGAGVYKIKE